MRFGKLIFALATIALPAAATIAMAQSHPAGYLALGSFDILAVLPPAPERGDARYEADRAIYKTTRALLDTPRWKLAVNDVKTGQADMMRDFSCAVGVVLTPENAPRLAALVARASADTGHATGIAKDHYRRLRPYQIDSGAVCQPAVQLQGSFDYPSGHTTLGWTWATLLAQLAPDRATAILARGRAFGESRIVCGVHNASAVEGGRLSAGATLTAMAGSPEFQADLAAARAELAALRGSAAATVPDRAQCEREAALVAQPIL
ncbi:phosphatase PAP2 family protein [Sphingomonas sp. dw_22]|uniref:acid phosphatase n=1 Tax=Sphingomonas sp. dw_22 TaxID=2721175 RepID=UPI0031FEDD2A